MQAIEITISKPTAKSGAEWAEYHSDTYDFVTLTASDDSMSIVVVAERWTSIRAISKMLSEDLVKHTIVDREHGRAS